jgi:aminoglycoside/choline kinase family phosphotransferase
VTRSFLEPDDLGDLVADVFGTGRRLAALDRLPGGSCKGVYRLTLDDGTSAILYAWRPSESYWPHVDRVPDDPFGSDSDVDAFASTHAALTGAGVRVPRLLALDRDGRYLDTGLALVEDAGGTRLEALMERDPGAAAAPLAAAGEALRRMHTTPAAHYGRVADLARGVAAATRPAEDVVTDRALLHLDAVAARDSRIAEARERIAAHLRELRAAVPARAQYGLVHGELGPDHILVTADGAAVFIDFEDLTYFDVEWDHAWLEMRFGDAYSALRPVPVDPRRMALYRYAQVLSLIEGPLRISDTDFPERQWMLDLAEWNIGKALAEVSTGRL